jgi:tetratricopeptide (TPR) repeat protein
LGIVYTRQENWTKARASFEEAIKVKKNYAEAHFGLGTALLMLKDRPGAITHMQEAVALKPDYAEAHFNLGLLLEEKGQWLKAVEHYEQSVKWKPKFAKGHYQLGLALYALKKLDRAETALRNVVKYDATDGVAHYSLGLVVDEAGRTDEAEKLYRRAIDLSPELPEAHCNLGQLLGRQGKFTEALDYLRKGHALALKIPKDGGKRRTGWNYDSARWIKECELLVKLDNKLAKALKENFQFDSVNEQFDLAAFCWLHKDLPAAGARFYVAALEAPLQPSLDVRAGHLFDAARAAALASAGKGKDAAKLDDKEHGRWRKQAVVWLRDALSYWSDRAKQGAPAEQFAIRRQLERWEQAPELATLRDESVLTKLADDERKICRSLWTDVRALLRQVRENTKLVIGKVLQGSLTRDDPIDTFGMTSKSHCKVHEISLEAGQPYLIDVRGQFDTFLRIESSQKKTLLFNDDIRPDDLNSRTVFLPPHKDTYRIVVTSYRPGATGSYALSVQKAAKVGEPTLIKENLQNTDKKNQGKFFKSHKLRLAGGSPYTIELESPKFDTHLVLLDGAGKFLTENFIMAPGNMRRSRIDFTPKADDTFVIVATSYEPGETGAYRLTLQRYEAAKDKKQR